MHEMNLLAIEAHFMTHTLSHYQTLVAGERVKILLNALQEAAAAWHKENRSKFHQLQFDSIGRTVVEPVFFAMPSIL
jgi:hypothetical protein